MSVTRIKNYIGGRFVPPSSDRWLDDCNPATGEVHAQVADSDATDVEQAVSAAKAAQSAWSSCSVEERAAPLARLSRLDRGQLASFSLGGGQRQRKTAVDG